jgi:hypothetical protein
MSHTPKKFEMASHSDKLQWSNRTVIQELGIVYLVVEIISISGFVFT